MSFQRRAECRADRVSPPKVKRERETLPYPYTHSLPCGTWYGYRDATHHYLKSLEKSPTRIVEGWASNGNVNSHGYSLNPRGCAVTLPAPLLVSHGKTNRGAKVPDEQAAVGEIFEARCSERGVYIRAAVWNTRAGDHAWERVRSGEYGAFSGAAMNGKSLVLRGVSGGNGFYDQWRLKEVSLCPEGACPGAVVTRFYEA